MYGFYHFEEEDLLTNFKEEKLPIYLKAIREYGDSTLYIDTKAYDGYGNILNGYCALRTKHCKDRSEFWRVFEILNNN